MCHYGTWGNLCSAPIDSIYEDEFKTDYVKPVSQKPAPFWPSVRLVGEIYHESRNEARWGDLENYVK